MCKSVKKFNPKRTIYIYDICSLFLVESAFRKLLVISVFFFCFLVDLDIAEMLDFHNCLLSYRQVVTTCTVSCYWGMLSQKGHCVQTYINIRADPGIFVHLAYIPSSTFLCLHIEACTDVPNNLE